MNVSIFFQVFQMTLRIYSNGFTNSFKMSSTKVAEKCISIWWIMKRRCQEVSTEHIKETGRLPQHHIKAKGHPSCGRHLLSFSANSLFTRIHKTLSLSPLTLPNPRWRISIAVVLIFPTSTSLLAISVLYTFSFMQPQRKKFNGVRPGDFAG